jgi:hypothetical protein
VSYGFVVCTYIFSGIKCCGHWITCGKNWLNYKNGQRRVLLMGKRCFWGFEREKLKF